MHNLFFQVCFIFFRVLVLQVALVDVLFDKPVLAHLAPVHLPANGFSHLDRIRWHIFVGVNVGFSSRIDAIGLQLDRRTESGRTMGTAKTKVGLVKKYGFYHLHK